MAAVILINVGSGNGLLPTGANPMLTYISKVQWQQSEGNLTNNLSWWRHQMETFSAILVLCEGNPPAIGGFPLPRPVTRNFDVFFDLRLNIRLSKQSRRLWLETSSCSLWRHCLHVMPIFRGPGASELKHFVKMDSKITQKPMYIQAN